MEKVKFIRSEHASGNYACKCIEEEVNDFLSKELPKLGGKLIDIKLSATAKTPTYLVMAMIIYKIEE